MDNTNKNLLLNAMDTTGTIDKIGYIVSGSNNVTGFLDTSFTVADGVATGSDDLDFTNSSGSDIIIIGIALFNSNYTNFTDTMIRSKAVAEDIFDSAVTIQDGETLRLTSYTYTID